MIHTFSETTISRVYPYHAQNVSEHLLPLQMYATHPCIDQISHSHQPNQTQIQELTNIQLVQHVVIAGITHLSGGHVDDCNAIAQQPQSEEKNQREKIIFYSLQKTTIATSKHGTLLGKNHRTWSFYIRQQLLNLI